MLRSEINALIRDAEGYFKAERFRLPPFAFWTPDDWAKPDGDISEIVDCGLGWDITDFGLGEYHTLRPPPLHDEKRPTREPEGGHREDLLREGDHPRPRPALPGPPPLDQGRGHHRAGGRHDGRRGAQRDAEDGSFKADTQVSLSLDGVRRKVRVLAPPSSSTPGESVTLEPGCYHLGDRRLRPSGWDIHGEVSVVNGDVNHNRCGQPVGRFPDDRGGRAGLRTSKAATTHPSPGTPDSLLREGDHPSTLPPRHVRRDAGEKGVRVSFSPWPSRGMPARRQTKNSLMTPFSCAAVAVQAIRRPRFNY